ncbi:CdaR family protein [Bacillus massiliigorillae]|uniref:CdaR family protein n=1 Tax=Bacillus massiliigorillae TaxID=1243664 RepID=UPI0003A28DCF|nr:CdaR family protein [Bacillus massiliigorillae]
MDKLIETPWFMKVIALSLAALLFISVNFDSKKINSYNTPSDKDTQVVENVPVEVYYDRDNLVVTGVPKTVDVKLNGPKNIMIPAATLRDFKVYVDLSDPEIKLGTKRVSLKIKDLNEKISYTIEPATVEVSVQEKLTKEFTVEPEYDRTLLAEGYIAEEPKVKPGKVKITGAKDVIEKIAYVKAIINIKAGANDTIYREVRVQALDRDLNKLDVSINPNVVEVEVPIKSPTKTMKIEPVASGNTKKGIEIESITTEPKEITLFGKKSVLDAMNAFQIPVDISKIEKNTVYNVAIELPDGIKASSVQEVKVKVSVTSKKGEGDTDETTGDKKPEEEQPNGEEANASKTFSNIPIHYGNLGDEFDLAFISPSGGSTSVSVTGKQSDLNSLKASDIQVSIQVDDLQEGEHTVPIKIETPANIDGKASDSTVKISITKKTAETF